jgi:transcriptional regulator with XRE-family HTH domain
MNYSELVGKALKGRSVTSVAKQWGVAQSTMDKWVKAERMPDYNTALRIAKEADVDLATAFEVIAEEERNHRARNFKLQMGFVQIELLLFLATLGIAPLILYYVK